MHNFSENALRATLALEFSHVRRKLRRTQTEQMSSTSPPPKRTSLLLSIYFAEGLGSTEAAKNNKEGKVPSVVSFRSFAAALNCEQPP
jgi:hypothetical protein